MRSLLVFCIFTLLTPTTAYAAGDVKPGFFSVEAAVSSILTALDQSAETLINSWESVVENLGPTIDPEGEEDDLGPTIDPEGEENDLGPTIVPDGEEADLGPTIDPEG